MTRTHHSPPHHSTRTYKYSTVYTVWWVQSKKDEFHSVSWLIGIWRVYWNIQIIYMSLSTYKMISFSGQIYTLTFYSICPFLNFEWNSSFLLWTLDPSYYKLKFKLINFFIDQTFYPVITFIKTTRKVIYRFCFVLRVSLQSSGACVLFWPKCTVHPEHEDFIYALPGTRMALVTLYG